ncbi:YciI family protein [Litoreibacter roseus]|uniref:YCII-related domain-containing protein n=1 Tax=Litoreibacter roseus TaxID=2601869 RepID=A0A6N6JIT8_9RHOB|nr:YciI family protein [Litoreibacter roseus]GFE66186.1 hypothetical protein KIN_32600 [Litoreibacter roseus]
MHYIINNHDNPDKAALRMEVREAHIAYLKSDHPGAKLVMAGPLLDGHGEMIGSHLVVAADDIAAVEQFQQDDPMAQSGLFLSSRIDPWKWVIGNPDAPAHQPS